MKYFLDTAPWINAVTLPHVLPGRIRHLLESEERKGLCSISLLRPPSYTVSVAWIFGVRFQIFSPPACHPIWSYWS